MKNRDKRSQKRGRPRPGGEEAGVIALQPRGVGLKGPGSKTGYP